MSADAGMMRARREEVESDILGGAVLSLLDFNRADDPAGFERRMVAEHRPLYVSCKVPAERVEDIHALEDLGFRHAELQYRLTGRVRPTDTAAFPYRFTRVESEPDLARVLDIVGDCFSHDRYTADPFWGSERSGERYRRFVRKSFAAADEALFMLENPAEGTVVGFGTNRDLGDGRVLLLLGGVRRDLRGTGLGAINDHFAMASLHARGFKTLTTHISATNYPILNLEVRHFQFRFDQAFHILRKTYADAPP